MESMTGKADDLVHTYKVKSWLVWTQVLSLFIMAAFFMIYGGIILGAGKLLESNTDAAPFAGMFLCMMSPFVVLIGLSLVQQVIGPYSLRSSYIKVTPEGIEWRYWPYSHIRCRWTDVDRIGKLLFFSDAFYLNDAELLGPSLAWKWPFRLFRPAQKYIALRSYNGWPRGGLAEDIRHFAPQVYEAKEVIDGAVQHSQAQAAAGQEQRLLAALAHAGVMVSPFGIFVALLIYVTQKGRSEFIRFQALQALIWQVVMIIVSSLITACMLASIFVPLLTAIPQEGSAAPHPLSGWVLVGLFGSMGLLMVTSIVFVFPAFIGALRSYRGEPFYYPLIGRRLEKMARAENRGSNP